MKGEDSKINRNNTSSSINQNESKGNIDSEINRNNNSSSIIASANYSCFCSIQLVSNSVNCNRCKRWRVKNCHRHYGNEQRKKFVFHIILC